MGVWILMLAVDLLVPALMIGFGAYFSRRAPKHINAVFGYRTARSMQNRDTWVFAHRHCGRLWFFAGWILLAAAAAAMLCLLGRNAGTIAIGGAIVAGAEVVVLVGSIIPTQRALKRTFDASGRRREE